jgi:hypothetical protein
MAHPPTTLEAMDLIVSVVILLIGFGVGFVAGVRNADSKKLKAAAQAADQVKAAVKTVKDAVKKG